MFLTKLKIAVVMLLATRTLIGTGIGLLSPQAHADKPGDKPAAPTGRNEATEVSGTVKSLDTSRNSLTLEPGKLKPETRTLTLAKDLRVYLDDGTGDKLGFQMGKLSDVVEGAHVTLRLEQEQVARILVEGQMIQGTLKAVNAKPNTVTASVSMSKLEPPVDKTFTVVKNAKLFIDDGQPVDKTKPLKSPTLADLPLNTLVSMRMSADRKAVGGIHVQGQSVHGVVKSVDKDKSSIVVAVAATKGQPPVDTTFTVINDALVWIDEGKIDKTIKPRGYSLADVPAGAIVTLRQSLDQKTIVAIRAEGASVHGSVTAVDTTKNVITLNHKADGDKAYDVSKDAVIYIDRGKATKSLADVPVGSNADVKMSPDGKTVVQIRAIGGSVEGKVVGKAGPDTITLEHKEGEMSYTLGKDVPVTLDEKPGGKLADLTEGCVASLRLSANKSMVLEIHARGPTYHGIVKIVDADKNMITLLIGSKDGEGGENREFKTSKDTVVLIEDTGEKIKLNDPRLVNKDVVLRMAIDQKAALRIAIAGD